MVKKQQQQKFDKEAFKKVVKDNVKTLYRKTLEEATDQQIFQAVCYAVKDRRLFIICRWNSSWDVLSETALLT